MENKRKTAADWIFAHLAYDGPDCLIWPYSRDQSSGYGRLGYQGKIRWAHRFICELTTGPRPSDDHEASHSCGMGHLGCVHPKHLSWKTKSENHLDRRAHGTNTTNPWGRIGKLTHAQVEEIKALKGKLTQERIAQRYGISMPTVRRVFKGKAGRFKLSENRGRISQLLAKRKTARFSEMMEQLGIKSGSLYPMLQRMCRDGVITQLDKGTYADSASTE